MSVLKLTKYDVIDRQLKQVIIMFFRDDDPISIHTVIEATNQLLYDLGAKSCIRDSDIIRNDKKKEWLQHLFAARNFFKHADRDKDKIQEFNIENNDYSLFDAVYMYGQIKKTWIPETQLFFSWFILKYPNFIKEDSELFILYENCKKNESLPNENDKQSFLDYLNYLIKN